MVQDSTASSPLSSSSSLLDRKRLTKRRRLGTFPLLLFNGEEDSLSEEACLCREKDIEFKHLLRNISA